MSKYKVKRFSRDHDGSILDSRYKSPETKVGQGIRAVGRGIKKGGEIAGKVVGLPFKGLGLAIKSVVKGDKGRKATDSVLGLPEKAVSGITGVLGDKISSVGDYSDKLYESPKETLSDTGKYIVKHPDEALINTAGTALMLSTPISATAFAAGAPVVGAVAATPGLTEAGMMLPSGYKKLKSTISEKLRRNNKKKKNKKNK